MFKLKKIIENLFNTVGNRYITNNFIEGPYDFKVNVRRGNEDDFGNYVIEIISVPEMSKTLRYRPELNKLMDGVDISVIRAKFKKLVSYVYPPAGTLGNVIEIKFIKESNTVNESEEKILQLPKVEFFSDLKQMFSFLKKRGYPKWKIKGDLILSAEDGIDSLHNLVEIGGDLDLNGTEISDLGPLRFVGGNCLIDQTNITDLKNLEFVRQTLSFDAENLESIGALKEAGGFDTWEMLLKAIKLGYNNGTLGSEIVKINHENIDDFISVDRDLSKEFLSEIMSSDYYNYLFGFFDYGYYVSNKGLNDTIRYYMDEENIEYITNSIKNNPAYDVEESFTENLINCDDDHEIRSAILDSLKNCAIDVAHDNFINKIESSLNEIGTVVGREYDEKGDLQILVNLDYNYLFREWFDGYEEELEHWGSPDTGDLYNATRYMISNGYISGDKPSFYIDDRYEPYISKKCFNQNLTEYL